MKLLIEVGSYDGSSSLTFYEQGYRVFSFEPKKDLYENIYNKTQHLENYTIIQKAVSSVDGVTMFNICKAGGASSILPFRSDEELNKTWSPVRTDVHYSGESYPVETTRLDTFIEQNGLQNTTIDYIHIDAQGVDLECLKSLGKYIHNVTAGVVETVMDKKKSIYIGQNENIYSNVEKFLMENGFTITKVENNDITNCEYNVYFKRIKPKNIAVLVYGRLDNCIRHYKNIMNSIGEKHNIDFFSSSDNYDNNIYQKFVKLYKPIYHTNEKVVYSYNFNKYRNARAETNIHNMTCHFINKERVFNLLEKYVIETNKVYDVVLSLHLFSFKTPILYENHS